MRDVASIIGLRVISSQEGRDLGPVSQVVVDLAAGVVEGLILGKGASEKGIEARDIDIVGVDAVMVTTHRVAKPLSELPTLLQKRRDPEAPPREVITDSGKRVGVVGAIFIDATGRRVTRYEISSGAWRDLIEGVQTVSPIPGTVDGNDSVVIPAAALGETELGGGLKSQIAKLGGIARTQAKQAAQSLEEGAEAAKRGVASVGEKASGAAAKVKETIAERTHAHEEEKAEAKPAAEGEAAPEAEKHGEGIAEAMRKRLQLGVAAVTEKASEAAAKVKEVRIGRKEAAPEQEAETSEKAEEPAAEAKEEQEPEAEPAQESCCAEAKEQPCEEKPCEEKPAEEQPCAEGAGEEDKPCCESEAPGDAQ